LFSNGGCASLDIIEENMDKLFSYKSIYNKISITNAPDETRFKDISGRNGSSHGFTTSSYKAQIKLYAWQAKANTISQILSYFPVEYRVIGVFHIVDHKVWAFDFFPLDNIVVRRGRPATNLLSMNESDGYIESPRFPKSYPEGIVVNYTLVNDDPKGFVRLTFSDYQVHSMSHLQVYIFLKMIY